MPENAKKTLKKSWFCSKIYSFFVFTKIIRAIRIFFVLSFINLAYFNCNHRAKTKNAVNKQKKWGQWQDLYGATRLKSIHFHPTDKLWLLEITVKNGEIGSFSSKKRDFSRLYFFDNLPNSFIATISSNINCLSEFLHRYALFLCLVSFDHD